MGEQLGAFRGRLYLGPGKIRERINGNGLLWVAQFINPVDDKGRL